VISARLGVDVGTLAAPAPFAQITVGVDIERFSLLAYAGSTGRVIGEVRGTGAGAQMFLPMGGLLGCYHFTTDNPSLSGCGGVELGSLEASGIGTADGRARRALWSAGVAQAVLDWHVTAASAVSVGVAGLVPARALHVRLAPVDVHETAAVVLRPWAGLQVRFE